MTGFLGAYADGQDLHGADLNADTATLAANDAAALNMLTGGWNLLVSGCALTAPSGLVVDVASGQATANGVLLTISAGSVTCVTNSGQANPRVDVVYAQLLPGGQSGTNPSSGNPTKADTYVLGVQQGTNAASPVAPTLPGANYVQLGVVNVPAGATSIASDNLGSQVTAPNAQGPTGPIIVNMLLHMAASMASAAVHGFQATSAGGTETNRLAQTDGNGAVGRANAGVNGSTAYFFGAPGATGAGAANRVVVADANGRAGDAGLFGGVAPSGYDSAGAASGVQTNLNTHAGTSPKTTAGVHNFNVDCGVFTPSATETTVNFNFSWPVAPTAVLVGCIWGSPSPGSFPTGFCKGTPGTTSFVARVTTTGVPYLFVAIR